MYCRVPWVIFLHQRFVSIVTNREEELFYTFSKISVCSLIVMSYLGHQSTNYSYCSANYVNIYAPKYQYFFTLVSHSETVFVYVELIAFL